MGAMSERTKAYAFGLACISLAVGYALLAVWMLGSWNPALVFSLILVAEGIGWPLLWLYRDRLTRQLEQLHHRQGREEYK